MVKFIRSSRSKKAEPPGAGPAAVTLPRVPRRGIGGFGVYLDPLAADSRGHDETVIWIAHSRYGLRIFIQIGSRMLFLLLAAVVLVIVVSALSDALHLIAAASLGGH